MWVLRLFITMCDKTLGTSSSILYPVACQLSPITLSKNFVMPKLVGKLKLSQLRWLHLYDLNDIKWQNPNYLNPDSECIRTTHTALCPSCCDVFVKYCADSWKPERMGGCFWAAGSLRLCNCLSDTVMCPTPWLTHLTSAQPSIHPSSYSSSFPLLALPFSQAQLLLYTPH